MGRKRSVSKSVAMSLGGLIVLLIVVAIVAYACLRVLAGRQTRNAMARLTATGAAITPAQVVPPGVPDDQNAALPYDRACASISASQDLRALAALDQYAYIYGDPAKRRKLEARVGKIVSDNAAALRDAAEGAARPQCRFGWGPLPRPRLTLLRGLRQLSTLLCAQAVLRADRGDLPSALHAWSVNLAIIKHLGSDPNLGAQLARGDLVDRSAICLARILQAGQPGAQDCRAAARALGRLDLRQAWVQALQAQCLTELRLLDAAPRNPSMVAFFVLRANPGPPTTATKAGFAFLRYGYPLIGPLDKAANLTLWEKRIALAKKRDRRSPGEARWGVPRYALLTKGLSGSRGDSPDMPHSALARVGLMQTALGLAAYRRQFGTYPASLDRLRTAVRWTVPEDPFGGKDFIYGRRGVGYLLYSVGPNLRDDGANAPVAEKELDDIVWGAGLQMGEVVVPRSRTKRR